MNNGITTRTVKVCNCGAPWEHKDRRLDVVPHRPERGVTEMESVFCLDYDKQGEPITRGIPVPATGAWSGPANADNCPTPKLLSLG